MRTVLYNICIRQGGYTPLHWAAEKELGECVKVMLQLSDIAAVVRMQTRVSLKEVIHNSRYNIFSICIVEIEDCFSLKVVGLMYLQ